MISPSCMAESNSPVSGVRYTVRIPISLFIDRACNSHKCRSDPHTPYGAVGDFNDGVFRSRNQWLGNGVDCHDFRSHMLAREYLHLESSLYAVLYTGLAKFSGGRHNLCVAFHSLGYTSGTSLTLTGWPFDQTFDCMKV